MGLENAGDWKEIISEYPELFGKHSPTFLDIKRTVVYLDFTERMHKFTAGAQSWREVAQRAVMLVAGVIDETTRHVVIAFDDPARVPANKECEQRARDTKKTRNAETSDVKNNDVPLTNQQIMEVRIAPDTPIPASLARLHPSQFIQKVISTRLLRAKVLAFVAAHFVKSKIGVDVHLTFDCVETAAFANALSDPEAARSMKFRKVETLTTYTAEQPATEKSPSPPTCVIDIYKNSVCYFEPTYPGEGEHKIVRHMFHYAARPDTTLYIKSSDTDLVPIILLTMRKFFSVESENIAAKILLDLTVSSSDTSKPPTRVIYDMVEMWRCINIFLSRKGIKAPVEVVCFLMALCGTDYTKKPGFMTVEKLFPFFVNEGYFHFFSESPSRRNIAEYGSNAFYAKTREEKDILKSPTGAPVSPQEEVTCGFPPISYSDTCGDFKQRTDITLVAKRIHHFIIDFYIHRLIKDPPESITYYESPNGLEIIKRRSEVNMPTDEQMLIELERCRWLLDYWANGALDIENNFLDPLAKTPANKSIFGWTRGEKGVERTNDIA